jgi:hypothetical protein
MINASTACKRSFTPARHTGCFSTFHVGIIVSSWLLFAGLLTLCPTTIQHLMQTTAAVA